MAHRDDTPHTGDPGRVEPLPDDVNAGADPASRDTASGAPSADAEGEPHVTRVVVWGTPPAIERGQRFAVRLGVACSAGRRPEGWRVEVFDHDGERRATAPFGEEPWPGTDALYHAEVALVAPDAEGLYAWEAVAVTNAAPAAGDRSDRGAIPETDVTSAAGGGAAVTEPGGAAAVGGGAAVTESGGAAAVGGGAAVTESGGGANAHAVGRARFGVRVVSAPDCRVTVTAVDAESGAPVEGARVVAHPYRTVTDARGLAELRVPAGEYRLFVSGKGCIPFRFDGEVTADTSIRAELEQDRELSDADIWS